MKKIMLVTGASRGIGAATAKMAAKNGYAVAVNYLKNKVAADAVVQHIHNHGGQALAIQADVSNLADIDRLFNTVDEQLGRLTVLVNNAGIAAPTATVAEMSAERIQNMMTTNIVGPMLCAQQAVARMATDLGGHGGAIVNVSSSASKAQGSAGANVYVDYAASKGALDTFTRGLSKEVAHRGIRVNAVRPGVTDTEIHANNGMPEKLAAAAKRIPIGRVGTVDEIAHAIMYLAESGFTTGAFLDVNGGS